MSYTVALDIMSRPKPDQVRVLKIVTDAQTEAAWKVIARRVVGKSEGPVMVYVYASREEVEQHAWRALFIGLSADTLALRTDNNADLRRALWEAFH